LHRGTSVADAMNYRSNRAADPIILAVFVGVLLALATDYI
jgi:hypothetical protein